ncbi:hypothetical protein EDB89DRAFT_1917630 [Lactarius sanguifluus]|nr:hypothetical protein EDB89DRAFT_1917630 [Lactarius sanguifluus]
MTSRLQWPRRWQRHHDIDDGRTTQHDPGSGGSETVQRRRRQRYGVGTATQLADRLSYSRRWDGSGDGPTTTATTRTTATVTATLDRHHVERQWRRSDNNCNDSDNDIDIGSPPRGWLACTRLSPRTHTGTHSLSMGFTRNFCEGSGFGSGSATSGPQTGPEPDWTSERFGVRHESPNRTRVRFGVQKKRHPNRTAPDHGNPNCEASVPSDSDSSSRTSHQIDEESERGDAENSDAYMDDEREPGSTPDHWTNDAADKCVVTDATEHSEHSMVMSASEVHADGESLSEPRANEIEMMTDVTGNNTVTTHTGPQQLVSVNQTEFTLEGQPTRRGRIRRTRDMMEVTACICGKPVENELKNADTAVQCGYRGCETLWLPVTGIVPITSGQPSISVVRGCTVFIQYIYVLDVNELLTNESTRECDSHVTSTRAREYSCLDPRASTSSTFSEPKLAITEGVGSSASGADELLTPLATHTTTTPTGRPIDDGSTTTILRQQQGRQVERWHDNNDGPRRRRSTTTRTTSHDDNGPRRQPPTMTTTHDDSGLRRQRPTTIRTTTTALATTQRRYYATAAAGSDRAAGVVGFVANEYSNYVNEYEYSHSRVLGAQTGTRAASTSITPENSASTRAYEYSHRRVRVEYELLIGNFRRECPSGGERARKRVLGKGEDETREEESGRAELRTKTRKSGVGRVGEEERDENGKSGALILRPDLEETLKSHKEKRDRTRRRGGIDNPIIHSSANTIAFIHPWGKGRQGVVSREEVDGWKHEANARQETRVASKVGESVKKGAWPNDSAGDLDDAHYEYKRKVRKYRSAEGEDVVEAIEVERMIEEWLEAVGVAIRDEVNPTLGVRRGRERRGHDEARNDEETRWEKERTGTRRDEENKDE